MFIGSRSYNYYFTFTILCIRLWLVFELNVPRDVAAEKQSADVTLLFSPIQSVPDYMFRRDDICWKDLLCLLYANYYCLQHCLNRLYSRHGAWSDTGLPLSLHYHIVGNLLHILQFITCLIFNSFNLVEPKSGHSYHKTSLMIGSKDNPDSSLAGSSTKIIWKVSNSEVNHRQQMYLNNVFLWTENNS